MTRGKTDQEVLRRVELTCHEPRGKLGRSQLFLHGPRIARASIKARNCRELEEAQPTSEVRYNDPAALHDEGCRLAGGDVCGDGTERGARWQGSFWGEALPSAVIAKQHFFSLLEWYLRFFDVSECMGSQPCSILSKYRVYDCPKPAVDLNHSSVDVLSGGN